MDTRKKEERIQKRLGELLQGRSTTYKVLRKINLDWGVLDLVGELHLFL